MLFFLLPNQFLPDKTNPCPLYGTSECHKSPVCPCKRVAALSGSMLKSSVIFTRSSSTLVSLDRESTRWVSLPSIVRTWIHMAANLERAQSTSEIAFRLAFYSSVYGSEPRASNEQEKGVCFHSDVSDTGSFFLVRLLLRF